MKSGRLLLDAICKAEKEALLDSTCKAEKELRRSSWQEQRGQQHIATFEAEIKLCRGCRSFQIAIS